MNNRLYACVVVKGKVQEGGYVFALAVKGVIKKVPLRILTDWHVHPLDCFIELEAMKLQALAAYFKDGVIDESN